MPSSNEAKSPGVIMPDLSRGDPGSESGREILGLSPRPRRASSVPSKAAG
jgi:hypothetical protein